MEKLISRPEWTDEIGRLKKEIFGTVSKAGGNPSMFNIDAIAGFLFAVQCNSLEVFRDDEGKVRVVCTKVKEEIPSNGT
jgi:hypothetical protein